MAGYAAAGGALVGGFVGSKSRPDRQISAGELQAGGISRDSLGTYNTLVGQGANSQDVANGAQGQRDLASMLKQYQGTGMYDFAAGRQLAAQQFDPQRVALQQSFSDQLQQANQAAALSGRGSNDPILRARLAQDQTRQQAMLGAQQNAAGVDFARQSVSDTLNLAGQRASVLQGLGQQAFTNYGNLFGMAQQQLGTERANSYQQQQLDATKGGGWVGALSGAMQGASSGASMGQSFAASGAMSRMNQPSNGPTQYEQQNNITAQDYGGGGNMPARSGGGGGGGGALYAPPSQMSPMSGPGPWANAPAYSGPYAGPNYGPNYGPQYSALSYNGMFSGPNYNNQLGYNGGK